MKLYTLLATFLATTALTSPTPFRTTLSLSDALLPRGASSASDIIAAIMPSSTSCASSAGQQYASDCRTNSQAAAPLASAMAAHNLTAAGQIAAVLATAGVESADLRYKHNVAPGRPGQGTAAMLMPDNVLKYAQSIPELRAGLALAGGDAAKVLDLVVDDRYNFAAAPWWLATRCAPDVVEGLASASDAAWEAYMGCLGVSASDSTRLAYWGRAKTAFGL